MNVNEIPPGAEIMLTWNDDTLENDKRIKVSFVDIAHNPTYGPLLICDRPPTVDLWPGGYWALPLSWVKRMQIVFTEPVEIVLPEPPPAPEEAMQECEGCGHYRGNHTDIGCVIEVNEIQCGCGYPNGVRSTEE